MQAMLHERDFGGQRDLLSSICPEDTALLSNVPEQLCLAVPQFPHAHGL